MLQIHTNNVPRDIIYGPELTESERAEFDYLDWSDDENADGWNRQFFRYRGQVHDIGDFLTTSSLNPSGSGHHDLTQWDGYASDSYFSGIVIRCPRDEWGNIDADQVIVGWYCA